LSWPDVGRWSELHDELERLFDVPLSGGTRSYPWMSGWTPALDVYEDQDQFVVKAELPGMKKADVDVSLHEGSLTLTGDRKAERQEKDETTYRSERYFGRFQRTVDLPNTVDPDKVKADYQDGILTITLPKTEKAKPKRISVSVK
jgi:HSP20 family protein